jgi:FKBP-type peptidyl-prolyl cis-trans isomerase SlpA
MTENTQTKPFLTVHYRISLMKPQSSDKPVPMFDTFSSTPATFELGAGYLPDFLELVLQQKINHRPQPSYPIEFSQHIPCAQAYGDRNPDLLQSVSFQLLEQDAENPYAQGDIVQIRFPNGHTLAGTFLRRDNEMAVIDFNHPMAGFDLMFEGKILGVL